MNIENSNFTLAEYEQLIKSSQVAFLNEIGNKKNKILEHEQSIALLKREIDEMENKMRSLGILNQLPSKRSVMQFPSKKGEKACWEYCLEIIRDAGKPLHVSEIIEELGRRQPSLKYSPSNFRNSISSRLLPNGLVRKTAPNTFEAIVPETLKSKIRDIQQRQPGISWNPGLLKKEIEIQFHELVSEEDIGKVLDET